jgi:hypothetical protein
MEPEILNTRVAALAAFLMLGGLASACSPAGGSKTGDAAGGEQGKFAGFEAEIPKWRTDILASDPLCRSQAEGEKCVSFEIACKAERTVTAEDTAKGVTARVVAAVTWNGFDSKFKHAQSGMAAAEFVKGPGGWTRTEHKPVNPQTCADL